MHGLIATNETVADMPAGTLRPRIWTVLPTTVAVPWGEGLATETIENPVGTVRLAEPICCVLVSFERVAMNVWVEPAAIG